jgi:hypothetical protein
MEQPTTPPPTITTLAVRGRVTAAGCYQIAIRASHSLHHGVTIAA